MAKRFSRKLTDGFQADNLCACMYATYLLTEYNVARGYMDFTVVEGELNFTDVSGRYHRDFHRWIRLSNGRIYDPTFGQIYKAPLEKSPVSDIRYSWRTYNEYSPEEILKYGCDITPEFKQYHYKPTKRGEFFRGAMWQFEVDDPELIPERFRA